MDGDEFHVRPVAPHSKTWLGSYEVAGANPPLDWVVFVVVWVVGVGCRDGMMYQWDRGTPPTML